MYVWGNTILNRRACREPIIRRRRSLGARLFENASGQSEASKSFRDADVLRVP